MGDRGEVKRGGAVTGGGGAGEVIDGSAESLPINCHYKGITGDGCSAKFALEVDWKSGQFWGWVEKVGCWIGSGFAGDYLKEFLGVVGCRLGSLAVRRHCRVMCGGGIGLKGGGRVGTWRCGKFRAYAEIRYGIMIRVY